MKKSIPVLRYLCNHCCTAIVVLVLSACSLCVNAQTVLINPAGDGGFENGPDLISNGWTEVNGATNNWFAGDPGVFGTNKAYISDDAGGLTYNYDPNGNSLTHFYRDITFPAGLTKVSLSFTWMGMGESSAYDGLQVSIAPTSVIPASSTTTGTSLVNGALVSGATVLGNVLYYNQSTEQTETITIPSSAINNCTASVTMRLIFSWRNDNSAGTPPPIAIDNISLTAAPYSLLSNGGVFTINNNIGTGGTNYKSFTDAITELNFVSSCGGFATPVVFNVSAGQVFQEDMPVITATGNASISITFQKSGSGANPVIRATGTTALTDAGITLQGGDYFTFDGIDVTINSGSTLEFGYRIVNASASNGAQNNTIKNVTVTLNRVNTNSTGISQNSLTTPNVASGTNSFNKYYNIRVQNAYLGITLISNAFFNDEGCEIGIINGGTTVIGTAVNDDIGGGTLATYGIRTSYQKDVRISNIEVRNVGSNSATNTIGISVENARGTCWVYNNKVHDIRCNATTGNGVVSGIAVAANTGSDVVNVYNNWVYVLESSLTNTGNNPLIRGISLTAAGGGSVNAAYNSVRIESINTIGNAAVYTASSGSVSLYNNIFANFSPSVTGVVRFAVYVSSGAISSDYNDLYVATGTNTAIGFYGSPRATLNGWQTATSGDANTKNLDPYFSSSTDLHIGNGLLNAAATPALPFVVTTDIDGDARDVSTPDIGSDEIVLQVKVLSTITYNQASTSIVARGAVNKEILRIDVTTTGNSGVILANNLEITSVNTSDADVQTSGVKLYRTSSPVFSTASLMGTGSLVGGKATFSGLGYDLPGNSTTYFWITYDVSASATLGNFLDAKVAANGLTIGGNTYPASDESPAGSRKISGPLSGTFLVGASQLGPNYTTLTDAISDMATFGIEGPVTFALAADYNSGLEANFPLIFSPVTGANANNTITIKPNTGVTATITAASSTAVIKFNGARYFTIDGSNNGSNSQNLTISNTGTGSGVWYASTGTNAGASNNTIKNCSISATSRTNINVAGITLSNTSSTALGGADNDSITIYNNQIQSAYYGIQVNANAVSAANGLRISGNAIGNNNDALAIGNTGINLVNANDVIIETNRIFNVKAATGTPKGINLGASCSAIKLDANTINNISYTGTSGFAGKGIDLASGVSNVTITNNSVYSITGDSWNNLATDAIVGIRLLGNTFVNIYNNSVNLGTGNFVGNNQGTLSAALYVANFSGGIDLRNNILATNLVNSTNTGAKSYAIYSAAGSASFSNIDYNIYYVSGSQGVLGNIGGVDLISLAAIQAGFTSNTASWVTDPGFTSATNLKPQLGYFVNGVAIAGVTYDITTASRYSIPDIGAYEGPWTGRWLGSTSTDWFTTTNWKDGVIPGATTDVAISVTAPNMPVLTAAASTKNLVMPVTATTVSLNGQVLNLSGAVTGSGTLTGNSESGLVINAPAGSLKFTSGSQTVKNITVNTGGSASLGTTLALAVNGTLSVASGATFAAGSNLTLKSSVTGTARIGTSAGTITGNISIERYIPGKRAFRFLSHPFTSSQALTILTDDIDITGNNGSTNGFTATLTNNPSAFWFNPATGDRSTTGTNPGWTAFTHTNGSGANAWTKGQGIRVLVRGTKGQGLTGATYTPAAVTLDMTGTVNSGNQSLNLANGYNLVGNPYPSPVNMGAAIAAAANINGGTFWVWDASAATSGAYVAVPVGSYNIAMNGVAVVDASATTTLALTEAAKVSASTQSVFRNSNGASGLLELHVLQAGDYWDKLYVKYDNAASTDKDRKDGVKMINPTLNFYTLSNDNQQLSLDARPAADKEDIIKVGLATSVPTTYTIKVANYGIAANIEVLLHDKLLDTYTELSQDVEYNFNVTADAATQGTERFELVQRKREAIVPTAAFTVKLSPNPAKDNVLVTFSNEQKAVTSISITSMDGKLIKTVNAGEVTSGKVNIDVKGLAKGTYYVTLNNGTNKTTQALQVQ